MSNIFLLLVELINESRHILTLYTICCDLQRLAIGRRWRTEVPLDLPSTYWSCVHYHQEEAAVSLHVIGNLIFIDQEFEFYEFFHS